MRFEISRARDYMGRKPPCDGAEAEYHWEEKGYVAHDGNGDRDLYEGAFERRNVTIAHGWVKCEFLLPTWYVEVNDLADVLRLARLHDDGIVLSVQGEGGPRIIIYDGYIE